MTITVPNSSPIDAQLPDQEMAAQGIIEQARVQFGRRVSGRWTKVRAGQAGRVIVEEAQQMRARAIVLPLPPRTGATAFGKTVETVLAERPRRGSSSRPVPRRRRRPRPYALRSCQTRVTSTARRRAILSAIMVVIGVLLLVLTFAGGGGPLSLGTILGVLFLLAGIMRLRLERSPR